MIKVGIFFGGVSREREISFAGGRTVYDNLDKSLFEAVPIFIDSLGKMILLQWEYIYKGTIRDFYPPYSFYHEGDTTFQLYIENLNPDFVLHDEISYHVGDIVNYEQLPDIIDVAFLCLHGNFGEDGSLQGILESLKIPYTGSGIRASAIGIDKAFQKKLLSKSKFHSKPFDIIKRNKWIAASTDLKRSLLEHFKEKMGLPFVIRPANQGSSIGVSIIKEDNIDHFSEAMDKAFFIKKFTASFWCNLSDEDKIRELSVLSDVKEGIGLPLMMNGRVIFHPSDLIKQLNSYFESHEEAIKLYSLNEEYEVVLEGFIHGKEFSCIVVEDENENIIALPPTEIIKPDDVFDYRSKYLSGLSRKITPIELPNEKIHEIMDACKELYQYLSFEVYARIDGFAGDDGKIYLNDPNTTSGMLPSSFFFHQAAEIGLNPSEFLTYILHISLIKRIERGGNQFKTKKLLEQLNFKLTEGKTTKDNKIKVAVILGGYSSERHISVESGRNVFEKLASSAKYEPIPIFLSEKDNQIQLHILPINFLLKDNADDIKEKILNYGRVEILEEIRKSATVITHKFADLNYNYAPQCISFEELKDMIDVVFIALHGRPGEDGKLQQLLNQYEIPYNGSTPTSSEITIDKYITKQILREKGILVADDMLVFKKDWLQDRKKVLETIETNFKYPLIAKPADDGCSSAVKKINNTEILSLFLDTMFRDKEEIEVPVSKKLGLKPKEEMPIKEFILVEELITSNGAERFLEVTGGMLTSLDETGEIKFEVFEPSEALATDDILSIEEKFLAGQGQNITPARFSSDKFEAERISKEVRKTLEETARLTGVEGYCRIDAFVRIYNDGRVETVIIEVNSLPGMTPATCIFHQASINGYKPYEFIDKILTFGMERSKINKHINN